MKPVGKPKGPMAAREEILSVATHLAAGRIATGAGFDARSVVRTAAVLIAAVDELVDENTKPVDFEGFDGRGYGPRPMYVSPITTQD